MRRTRNLHYTITSMDRIVWFSQKLNKFVVDPVFGDGTVCSHKHCNTLKSAIKFAEKCSNVSPSRKSLMTRWCKKKGNRVVQDFICDKNNA